MTCASFDVLATRVHGDWRALLATRINVLVTAPNHLATHRPDELRALLAPELRQPVSWLSACAPSASDDARTVVISDVHLLDSQAQRALMSWIGDPAHADAQVVSVTPTSLFARVMDGRFDANLFYRLNTIHLNLTDEDAAV